MPHARRASTGPRTTEGLARSRRTHWKDGLYSAEVRAEHQLAGELLTQSREWGELPATADKRGQQQGQNHE
jgi:hypothetical protein